MTDLKTQVTDQDLREIKHPEIIEIMRTIKKIQNRMKDPDVKDLEYIRVYDKLGKEFDDFFTRNTGIFVRVIRGENLATLASVLYYRDKVLRGLMTQEEIADKLANKFLPAHLKAESDIKLKEMRARGEI